MAEAFGVAANIAGLVSLGLTLCQGLLTCYSSWKNAPADIEGMRESIKALSNTFKVLDTVTKNEKFGTHVRNIVEQRIESCEGGLKLLESKLDKIKITPES